MGHPARFGRPRFSSVSFAPLVTDAECQFVQDVAPITVAQMERGFRDATSAGEVPPDFPLAARASEVMHFARGVTMRAQMGAHRKTLLRDAEGAADPVLLPRCETVALES